MGKAWGDATLILPLISSAMRGDFPVVVECEAEAFAASINGFYRTVYNLLYRKLNPGKQAVHS